MKNTSRGGAAAAVVVLLLILPFWGLAQTVKWEHARDYLGCKLALAAIESKVSTDSGIRGKLAAIEPALKKVTIDSPLEPGQLDGVLKDFSLVKQRVSDPVGRIDVKYFAGMASPLGAKQLVDSAFALAGKGYVVAEAVKNGLRAEVSGYLKPEVKPAVIAAGGQPNVQQVPPVRRGFDFWVLLPILLLGAFAFIVWKKYGDLKEDLRARKRELRSFNENYFNLKSAAGPDRKEVERLIANSNVLAELNEAISKLQLRVSQLEGKGAAPVGSAVVSGGGKEKMRPKGSDGAVPTAGSTAKQDAASADVFYMAGPVNNYFPNSAKSLTKDNTVYKFKLSANKQEAEYELHTSGAPIMEIVQLAESYIKAACDEENLPSYPVRNIITKKAGQAVLEGDKWVIKSKALIRYE